MVKHNIVAEFIESYEPWEQYLKVRFGDSNMHRNTLRFRQEENSKCKELGLTENDLLGLLNLRNVCVHAPSFVIIKPKALGVLKRVTNAFCKKAMDIAIPEHKIYKANLNSNIEDVIKVMARKLYTHVPVVDRKEFIGIFSENTLLKLTSRNEKIENTTMEDIKSFLRNTKGTDDYKFLPTNAEFYEVYKLFQEYIDKRKRLGVVFLTKNGQESGKIKGLITAWDLHKGITMKLLS